MLEAFYPVSVCYQGIQDNILYLSNSLYWCLKHFVGESCRKIFKTIDFLVFRSNGFPLIINIFKDITA